MDYEYCSSWLVSLSELDSRDISNIVLTLKERFLNVQKTIKRQDLHSFTEIRVSDFDPEYASVLSDELSSCLGARFKDSAYDHQAIKEEVLKYITKEAIINVYSNGTVLFSFPKFVNENSRIKSVLDSQFEELGESTIKMICAVFGENILNPNRIHANDSDDAYYQAVKANVSQAVYYLNEQCRMIEKLNTVIKKPEFSIMQKILRLFSFSRDIIDFRFFGPILKDLDFFKERIAYLKYLYDISVQELDNKDLLNSIKITSRIESEILLMDGLRDKIHIRLLESRNIPRYLVEHFGLYSICLLLTDYVSLSIYYSIPIWIIFEFVIGLIELSS